MNLRSYSELITLPTFKERYEYLKLNGVVGKETFGWDRYINQNFYHSEEWKSIRDYVIVRDNGCDLGVPGYEIYTEIYVHHMNPVDTNDIIGYTDFLVDPEFLICTSFVTHNGIHYGKDSVLNYEPVIREPNDTKLW